MMELIWCSFLISVLVLTSLNLLFSFYVMVRNDIRDERERKTKLKTVKSYDHY